MQIRKTYKGINPQLLYDEMIESVTKQGTVLDTHKLETYSLPSDSSTFIYRGTLTFKMSMAENECVRIHMVGSDKSEIKILIDVDESQITAEKIAVLQNDLDFILGSYELKPK